MTKHFNPQGINATKTNMVGISVATKNVTPSLLLRRNVRRLRREIRTF